jgi:DNA replication protein DnaC
VAAGLDTATCPLGVCDGSGFVVDEDSRVAVPCACRPQQVERRRARSLSAVIPRKYRAVSFDQPPVTEIAEPVVRAVRRYVSDIDARLDAGDGLWLEGDVGTGKTTLAMLVSRAALDVGRSVAIYSVPRLLAAIRSTFDADSEGSYVDFVDRLTRVDLLHLDDLGAERSNSWVLEQLYAIVNARYEDERSILITTNLPLDELGEQITPRTVSRLKEMCDVLPLYGADARARLRSV